MTTIAANRARMCWDSLGTAGTITYEARKLYRARGAIIGVAGSLGKGLRFVRWYAKGCPEAEEPDVGEDEFQVLVLDRSGLFEYDSNMVPIEILDPEGWAIGSGMEPAITALRLGKTPAEAVEVACMVDGNSRPPVQTEAL